MSPEEQRIAIAEVCGWKILPPSIQSGRVVIYLNGEERGSYWTDSPDDAKGRAIEAAGIPDYLSDLNAMHAAVATLPDKAHFLRSLQIVTLDWDNDPEDEHWLDRMVFATAPQWAAAFVMMIEDDKEALRRAGEEG